MVTNWNVIKTFSDTYQVTIQWVDLGTIYFLKAYEGRFEVECYLVKDAGADVTDFEANYKLAGNKPGKTNVVQVLGKDTLSLSPRAMKFTAPASQVSVFDKQLDETLVIRGGVLYSPNSTLGDSIKVSIIDKDNVLGQGGTPEAPLILGQYVKEWFIMPAEQNELIDVSISQSLPQGVYIRIEYTSIGSSPVDVVANFIAYEFTG